MSILEYLYGRKIAEEYSNFSAFTLVKPPKKLVEDYGENSLVGLSQYTKKRFSKMNCPWAIGISPNNKTLLQPEWAISRVIAKIVKISYEYGYITSCVIVGETAPRGRWHYHGYISFKNITAQKKVKKALSENFARCVIQPISSPRDINTDYLYKSYIHSKIYEDKNYMKENPLDKRNVIWTWGVEEEKIYTIDDTPLEQREICKKKEKKHKEYHFVLDDVKDEPDYV